MSYWYWRPLKQAWVLDENATNRFDLPSKGALSGLQIRLDGEIEGHEYATDDLYPAQKTDVRIIGNGNHIIVDLRNRQLQAINHWEKNIMPNDTILDTDTAVCRQHMFIPFGRFMGDLKYGLILNNFEAGVQFEDTNTISTDNIEDGSLQYTIYGLFRKNPEAGIFNGGYFKKRQVLNRDTLGATQHSVKLPTLKKLKQAYLFAESDWSSNQMTVSYRSILTYIWLSLKSGDEYIVDNVPWRQFYQMMHYLYNREPMTHGTTDLHTSEDNFYDTRIYDRKEGSSHMLNLFTQFPKTVSEYKWDREERVIRQQVHTGDGLTRSGGYVNVKAIGTAYNGLCPLLMIDPMAEEEDYLDADKEGDVNVEFTESASTENIYIVLDELQKVYPI